MILDSCVLVEAIQPLEDEALLLLALFLLLQLLGAIPLAPLAFVADMATVVCLVNVVACLAMLWFGFRKTHRSMQEVFPFTSFCVIVLLPLTLALIGLHIILSEADNVTRWLFPMPVFEESLVSDLAEGGLSSDKDRRVDFRIRLRYPVVRGRNTSGCADTKKKPVSRGKPCKTRTPHYPDERSSAAPRLWPHLP